MNSSTAVIYLARAAEGLHAFRRFVESYQHYDAGIHHDLVILYKGFASGDRLDAVRQLFAGISQVGIELDDEGFDIGSYFQASQRLEHRDLVFLNTHTTIESAGWLFHLHRYGCQEGCGIAGAMGSYESLLDSIPYLEAVIAASFTARGYQARQLAAHFDFLLPRFRPDWYGAAPKSARLSSYLGRFGGLFSGRPLRNEPDRFGELRGAALIWPGAPELDVRGFPPFPNPHIRSNGFMVRRERFLALSGMDFQSKAEANLFESGKNSISAQLRRSGLAAVVVGADGDCYPVEDWPRSRTFRLEDQGNLLIGDNHTRAFSAMSNPARQAHAAMTWGDYAGEFPDLPRFGFRFGRGSLAPQLTASDDRSEQAGRFHRAKPIRHGEP